MNAIANTPDSETRGIRPVNQRGKIADAAFYTRVATSIASRINVSGTLMQHCREAIDSVNRTTNVWEKSLYPIEISIKYRKSTEYYHPKDPRREKQLLRERKEFQTLWKAENSEKNEEPMSEHERNLREKSSKAIEEIKMQEIQKNTKENEEDDNDCECLGVPTKTPVTIITLDDEYEDYTKLSNNERTSRKRGYDDDVDEGEKTMDIDSRSLANLEHQQDSINVHKGPPEKIDECVPPKAKRAKSDTESTSTIMETPELLDERVGNAEFLVRIPRTAITLNLNSYMSVSSKKNLSPSRTSTEIRVADSSVPDISPIVDNNHNTIKKINSTIVGKKLKIIEDVTCIEGTILSTTTLKQSGKDSNLSSEKSLKNSTIETKKFTDKNKWKDISVGKIQKNSAGAEKRKKSSRKQTKNLINPTKHERIQEKLRTLFGNEATLTESDEECKLISKLTSRKRQKESRMSSDSGVCLTELTSDSMISEIHDKLDDEITFKREELNTICDDKLVKSMPSLDCASLETSNSIIKPQKALPDSSTNLEEKSLIRPDSSSYDQITISIAPLNKDDSDVCDPLNSKVGLSNETQISTPTSTTACLPIDTSTKIDPTFEDLKSLISMDLKTGCRIDMQGNRISIHENPAVIDEDSMNCYNDDENRLVIDERSCSDDFETVQSLRHDESSKDDNKIIDASVNILNIEEISRKTESNRDLFVPQSSNADEIILPNTLDDYLASETIEKTSISMDKKMSFKLPNGIESYKNGSIVENQNSTNLKVTNSGMKTKYKETSILNVIVTKNLPVLSSADKVVSNLLSEKTSNTGINGNTNVEIEVDNLFEKLTSDIAQINSASERERKNENPHKNLNNKTIESKIKEPIIATVDETKVSRAMNEVLPDSELPTFLIEAQKTKEIPKMSTFRVLHPTELGARWCPTPLDANVPNQNQLQHSSNPLVVSSTSNFSGIQSSASPLMTQNASSPLMVQNSSSPLMTQNSSSPLMPQNSSCPMMTQNSSCPMMTQNSSCPLMTQNSSSPLMLQSSSYQHNNTNQLPLPTTHQIQVNDMRRCQYNSMQQVSVTTIVEPSRPSLYSSIAQIGQTFPTALTRDCQPPPYPSIPQNHPQRPPVVMMRVPTSLDHLHDIVNTTLPPTQGAQDLSSKISSVNQLPERRPPPNYTGIAAPNNHYIRPTLNYRQQSSTTSVPSNSYQINNGPSIVNQPSILSRICNLLISLSWRLERLDKEHEMYKIFQLLMDYNDKLQLLIPELEKYAKIIGTRDRQIIMSAIIRYYEELIEPSQRILDIDKVMKIFNKDHLMQPTITSQSSIQPLFTELQYQTLRRQIAAYRQISCVLYYQLVAQSEATMEVERLKKLEATKAKRVRRKRTPAVQEHSNVQIINFAPSAAEHINYQQTIESTIERILREDTVESNNVSTNVNEEIINENNIRINNNDENIRDKSIDNNVTENLCDIFRRHPVSKNLQDNNIDSNIRNKTNENNSHDKTMECNVRNKTIETTVHDKTVENNIREKVIDTNVQDDNLQNNIVDKIIETNVRNENYDKVIENNVNVETFEKEKITSTDSMSEKSFSSIEDGNTSVLDVLKEFDVLDSMSKERASKISKSRRRVEASALTKSKKFSKKAEITCPNVSPQSILNTPSLTENSESPKTETLKNVTLGSKPAEIVKTNSESSVIVSTIEEVVENNDEILTKVSDISKVVERNNESTNEIPVITLDDDNLDDDSINSNSMQNSSDIIEIDSFNILEVKSISKDVFNNMGDAIDEMALADRVSNKLSNENDIANECIDSKTEGTNCFNCGKQSTLACERCRTAFYCSTNCHQKHWSVIHHLECKLASTES